MTTEAELSSPLATSLQQLLTDRSYMTDLMSDDEFETMVAGCSVVKSVFHCTELSAVIKGGRTTSNSG